MDSNDTAIYMYYPLITGDPGPKPEAMTVYGRIRGVWLTVRNWKIWVPRAIRLVGKVVRISCAILSLACMGYATYKAGRLDLIPNFWKFKLICNIVPALLVAIVFGSLSYVVRIVLRLVIDCIDSFISGKILENNTNLFWKHSWALLNGVVRFILAVTLSVNSTLLGNAILNPHSHLGLMLLFFVAFMLMILSSWEGDDMGFADTIMCLCLGIIAYTFATTWRMVALAAIPSMRYVAIPLYALMWEWADQLDFQAIQEPLENRNQVPATQVTDDIGIRQIQEVVQDGTQPPAIRVAADAGSGNQAPVRYDSEIRPIQESIEDGTQPPATRVTAATGGEIDTDMVPIHEEEELQMLAQRDNKNQAIVLDSQDLIEKLRSVLNSLNIRGSG